MFKLLIADDEGKTTVVPLVRDEITVGRKEGNTIRLTERNVSRKHAKLRRANGTFVVSDLRSSNGVRVNGRRIEGDVELKPGDQIVIGDYQLALQFEGTDQIDTSPATAPSQATTEIEGPTALVSTPPVVDPGPPARLVMVSPPTPGAEFALSRSRLRIGRAEDLEVWVNHRSISREHAEIAVENGAVFIRDLASANGVRVNGVDTKQGPIRSGDVVELGQVRFRMVGAGEHFQLESDRTIQMDAFTAPPPVNRTPLYVAAGIVAIALVAGVGVALSGGGVTEPSPTTLEGPRPVASDLVTGVAAPSGPSVDEQVIAATHACQISLSSGNFAAAIASANEALALRPDDLRATECLGTATRIEAEDRTFSAGASALRAGDVARAVASFDAIPDGSSFLDRPEVHQAYEGHARELLAQARFERDPGVVGGLAQQILQLRFLDPELAAQAEALSRRGAGLARGPRAPVPPRPVGVVPRPPETLVAGPSGGSEPAGGSVDEEVSVCLGSSDFACVIRLLGNGRARTARQLNSLMEAQRRLNGVRSACGTIAEIIQRFPASREATRARQVGAAQCQGLAQ